VFIAIVVVAAAATAGATALVINIFERKAEARTPYIRVVEVGEDDTAPAKWGRNWEIHTVGDPHKGGRSPPKLISRITRAGACPDIVRNADLSDRNRIAEI
jgi:hypothetical protein